MAVWRNELHISLDSFTDALNEHLRGNLRHPEFPCTLLHTASIERRIHHTHHAVLAGKRLEALKDGDAIVKRTAVDVQQDVGGRHKRAHIPTAILPCVLHIAVQRPDLEAKIVPAVCEVVSLGLPDARCQVGVDLLVLHQRRRRCPKAGQLHIGPWLRGGCRARSTGTRARGGPAGTRRDREAPGCHEEPGQHDGPHNGKCCHAPDQGYNTT
mmetsp:Transcript_73373/g.215091  ORF Transcript_73373/g.215091 Transcript_73373/m.215091 type:complete len:212 (+) Transcript_73373:801-1436(+)